MKGTPMNPDDPFFDPSLFTPSLSAAIGDRAMKQNVIWRLAMAVVETEDDIADDMEDRRDVVFTDGKETIHWRVESLTSLFRGEEKPPSLERFPKEYIPLFATIEDQVFVYADLFGDPTDEEMKAVYSDLARLPDGRGRSLLHNHMWQACALALGARPWSRAQLEAVLRRLVRSCRTFHTHPGSRNYINPIRRH